VNITELRKLEVASQPKRGSDETSQVSEPICQTCRRPEDEHCVFIPLAVPSGCMCDVFEWGDRITDVCEDFLHTEAGAGRCENCEHDRACHKGSVK